MTDIIGGTVYFLLDGVQYKCRGDVKYFTGSKEKTGVMGTDGFHGVKVTPVLPYLELSVSDSGGLDSKTLEEANDVTATLELGSGKQVVYRNAYSTKAPEMDAVEGQGTLRIEAPEAEEVTVGG